MGQPSSKRRERRILSSGKQFDLDAGREEDRRVAVWRNRVCSLDCSAGRARKRNLEVERSEPRIDEPPRVAEFVGEPGAEAQEAGLRQIESTLPNPKTSTGECNFMFLR